MIRHRLDYAAVLLLDERFTPKQAQDQISGWMRPFPNIAWLAVPMDFGVPFLLFAGSGIGCLRLVKKLPDATQRYLLTAIAGLLVVLGAVFVVPTVNVAVKSPPSVPSRPRG